MEKIKTLCIIQARMGSTRLPGKVLLKIGGVPLLEYEIKRIEQVKKVDKIVVATTVNKQDDKIEKLSKKIGVACFRGSENDVLDRYYQCALKYPQYGNIIRITGDCPLIDPEVIDGVITFFDENDFVYACNVEPPTFPDGMDMEIFKKSAIVKAAKEAKLVSEREHVTPYIRNKMKIRKGNFANQYDFSHFRLTVDNKEDFEVIKFLIENSKITDGFMKYISLLTKNSEIMAKNMHIVRNEGYLKSLKNDYKTRK
jgi:spore coat polysaccharide biosynthesis protein SpsF (cytidylyltransferase family)